MGLEHYAALVGIIRIWALTEKEELLIRSYSGLVKTNPTLAEELLSTAIRSAPTKEATPQEILKAARRDAKVSPVGR